jgi:acetolactate synthase-1/2/3 large subunit
MADTQHRTAAHWLLEALVEQGIEYLFGNLGTDHAPLIEEMARWRREGRRPPELVLCAHENTAVHMAGGYALATGRAQAVLVHVDAGTANAAMALHNLCRTRVPVLVMAGRAPFSSFGELHGGRDTYVHFVQEPFDQAGIVRPYVKWEYTLQSGVVAQEVVTRACTVMRSDPMGPVYLMLPREVLASTCPPAVRAFSPSRQGPVRAGGAHPEAIAAIAARLLVSEEPLLVTAYAGRNPAAVESIERLALLAGVRVCEFNPVHLNIRRDSPCFGGYQPAEFAQTTDLGLLVDVDVPWIPRTTRENPAAFWVQMDIDAVKRDMPMWSFPADLRIEGDSERLMSQLVEAVTAIATPDFRRRVERRLERMAAEHAERKRAAAQRARDPGTPDRLNPHHVCAALGRAIGPDDIVLNEAIRNMPVVFEQIPRSRPGSLLGFPGGGLGFSGGMALGYKLARPHRRVVHVIGDGVFHFSNPTSLYAVARRYGLPVFTVILDNGGWAAVKEATLRMYPDGESSRAGEFGATVAPGADFARVAESSDAYGEMLTDPAETDAAIGRCLSALDDGRSALLHVRLAPL